MKHDYMGKIVNVIVLCKYMYRRLKQKHEIDIITNGSGAIYFTFIIFLICVSNYNYLFNLR